MSGPVPPTMFAVFRVEPGNSPGGIVLVMVTDPVGDLRTAEQQARGQSGTCLVIKLTPVGVYRGRPQ